MMDVAKTSDAAVEDWERFRQRLEAVDYRVMIDMPLLQVMRYAYDAGWADGQLHGRRVPAPPPADGDPPPGWEPAYLEG